MREKRKGRGYAVTERTRPLRCVQCGWRVLDAVGNTRVQIFPLANNRCPDFIVKCMHCGTEIGILKTE